MTNKRLPLQAHTISNAIDLAFLVYREFFSIFFKTVLLFLLVNCSIVFVASFWYAWNGWLIVLCLFFTLVPLGNLLVWTIARKELIEPFAISNSFQENYRDQHWASIASRGLGHQIIMGILSLLLLIPGIIFACKTVFSQEKKCFDEEDSKSQQAAWKFILSQEALNLFGYILLLFFFWYSLSLLLFLAVDLFCSFILNFSFALGGLEEGVGLWSLFTSDPYVMTLFTACLIFTFPLVRLAWMFCYISLRVKSDCWDIGTRIKREIHRLQLSHD